MSKKQITEKTLKAAGKIISEMEAPVNRPKAPKKPDVPGLGKKVKITSLEREEKAGKAVVDKFFSIPAPKKMVKKPVGAKTTSMAEAEKLAKQPKPTPQPEPEVDLVKKMTKVESDKRAEKRKVKASKQTTKDVATKKSTKGKSITQVIYELFAEKGVDNVKPEEAIAAALAVKPESKFDKWHLYFHRRNYKAAVDAGEMPLEKWS